MGARIAHGERDDISIGVLDGRIPPDTIVITHDEDSNPELIFVNSKCEQEVVCEKTRFQSVEDAEYWFIKYPSPGLIISVLEEDGEWYPYIVKSDNSIVRLYPDTEKEIIIDANPSEDGD